MSRFHLRRTSPLLNGEISPAGFLVTQRCTQSLQVVQEVVHRGAGGGGVAVVWEQALDTVQTPLLGPAENTWCRPVWVQTRQKMSHILGKGSFLW